MKITGLFMKMAILVLGLFAIVILFLIFYIPNLVRQDIINGIAISSEQTANQFKGIRSYYTKPRCTA